MRYPGPVHDACFLRRYKRFFAEIRFPDGTVDVAHCANPGSMLGAIQTGAPAYVSEASGKGKLRWSLEALRVEGTWIGVHPVRANRVVEEGLAAGGIAPLRGYTAVSREPKIDAGSRSDFLLTGFGRPPCWIEVKNVTLARGRLALFPDSVTLRGLRHLRALERRVARGERAVLLLVASRGDVTRVGPADGIDPDYGEAFRRAREAGVEILGYRMRVGRTGLFLDRRIPISPGPHPYGPELWPPPDGVVSPDDPT